MPAHVRMYVCGPTVYDYVHIGNARPVVAFDVLYRLLKRRYPRVTYVRNITDIDDRIIVRRADNKETIEALTTRTGDAYQSDMSGWARCARHRAARHRVCRPDGRADRAADRQGPCLCRRRPCAVQRAQHARLRPPVAPAARRAGGRRPGRGGALQEGPGDFVLWKPSTDEQPGWDSPWGRGRPGWHIECSAMSAAHLGETFDIHAGGLDLIFPHHENEIAQSRSPFGHAIMAKYWMHNGFLNISARR
jgi:cysteinyl-tRNA synthetase